jgi:hypothetical protein
MESLTNALETTRINGQDDKNVRVGEDTGCDDKLDDHTEGMKSLMKTLHLVNTFQMDRIGEQTEDERTEGERTEGERTEGERTEGERNEGEWTEEEWKKWNNGEWTESECIEAESYEGLAYRENAYEGQWTEEEWKEWNESVNGNSVNDNFATDESSSNDGSIKCGSIMVECPPNIKLVHTSEREGLIAEIYKIPKSESEIILVCHMLDPKTREIKSRNITTFPRDISSLFEIYDGSQD